MKLSCKLLLLATVSFATGYGMQSAGDTNGKKTPWTVTHVSKRGKETARGQKIPKRGEKTPKFWDCEDNQAGVPSFPAEASVKEGTVVAIALTKSLEELATSEIAQSSVNFLANFVAQYYFPRVIGEGLLVWRDIFQAAKSNIVLIEELYNQRTTAFLAQIAQKTGKAAEEIDIEADKAIPVFFKALYDLFEERDCAREYMIWLSLAAPAFHKLLVRSYPHTNLTWAEANETQKGLHAVPSRKGGMRSFTESIVRGLDALTLDDE